MRVKRTFPLFAKMALRLTKGKGKRDQRVTLLFVSFFFAAFVLTTVISRQKIVDHCQDGIVNFIIH